MNHEEIKQRIAYIESDKIKKLKETIEFYQSVGARKDLSGLHADLADLERTVANLKTVVNGSYTRRTDVKVRVTEYQGRVVIETLNIDEFDVDFVPAGNGLIGCSLGDNSRLGISKEALELMDNYQRVRDAIGDLMGEEDHFSWIGGPIRVLDTDAVVCKYFKMPKGFVEIENTVPEDITQHIDSKAAGSVTIDYKDFEQELWIELSKSGGWKPKADNPKEQEYRYDDYYKLENMKGARFVGGRIYDPEVKLVNVPDGMLKTNEEGHRTVLMPKELETEILETCQNIFRKGDELSYQIKVDDKDIMSYINPLFDLGFDNNVMNPRDGYWRMSITATPEKMLEKLKAFKRETVSA